MRELIQYIAQFKPSYAGTVIPAKPAQIDRLLSLIKRPLPTMYRNFLETMGRSWGDFEPFDEPKDFSIETVIGFYENPPHRPPDQLLFIAYDRGSCGADLFLEDLGPTIEPQVVEFPSDFEFDSTRCSVLY